MVPRKDQKGFSFVELMMAVGFTLILMAGVYGFYNSSGQIYSSGIAGQTLQDGANTVIRKIIDGQVEADKITYRLATSASYFIPDGNPSQLYFCQDNSLTNPCSPADTTARWYNLDPTNTSLRYYHPTANPLGYDVLYTAPAGSTLTLRFAPPTPPPPPAVGYQASVVQIDVALIQNLNNKVAASGTATTYVLLRNHS